MDVDVVAGKLSISSECWTRPSIERMLSATMLTNSIGGFYLSTEANDSGLLLGILV
jgi:hypothetical protein